MHVGKYNIKFNEILGVDIQDLPIFRSKGLPSHMIKRKHFRSLKHIDDIPEIISNPDYLGINPNEHGTSIEFVKKYEDNVILQRVPEMMDTPPIQNNDTFIINMRNKIYSRYRGSLNEFRRSIKGNRKTTANNR